METTPDSDSDFELSPAQLKQQNNMKRKAVAEESHKESKGRSRKAPIHIFSFQGKLVINKSLFRKAN